MHHNNIDEMRIELLKIKQLYFSPFSKLLEDLLSFSVV